MREFRAQNNTKVSANTDLSGVMTLSVGEKSIDIPAGDFVEISDYLLKKRNRWGLVTFAAGLLFFTAISCILIPGIFDLTVTHYFFYLIGGSVVLAFIGKIGEKLSG